jgi:RNA polymerase sigma-70 factor (ECF subfamily)
VRPPRDEEFERLYAEHAQALYGFLAYRTGDRVLAEDLLADTFERALRARRRFDRRRASEKTWLYAIALNLVRDQRRRSRSEQSALRDVAAVAAVAAGSEGAVGVVADRDLVQRALASLAPEEREAIALRYGAELTMPEIAKLTHERLTTVEGRVYRALRKMRTAPDGPLTRERSTGRCSPAPPRAAPARAPSMRPASSRAELQLPGA